MDTTGEECFHQKPMRYYFDSDYDLIFDASIEHYCVQFAENVIPAQRCGTCCPNFHPLKKMLSPIQTGVRTSPPMGQKVADISGELAHAERVRVYLRQGLSDVGREIERNAKYLERQIPAREQHWQQTDAWLNQLNTKTEVLGRAVVKTNQDLSVALTELQRVRRQLQSAKAGRRGSQDLEQLWLDQEKWEHEVQHAERAKRRAETMLLERSQKETELNQLYARWEDAVERVPLLIRLRAEAERYVESWLVGSGQHLSEPNAQHIANFLRLIQNYSADDVPLSKLRTMVEKLSNIGSET